MSNLASSLSFLHAIPPSPPHPPISPSTATSYGWLGTLFISILSRSLPDIIVSLFSVVCHSLPCIQSQVALQSIMAPSCSRGSTRQSRVTGGGGLGGGGWGWQIWPDPAPILDTREAVEVPTYLSFCQRGVQKVSMCPYKRRSVNVSLYHRTCLSQTMALLFCRHIEFRQYNYPGRFAHSPRTAKTPVPCPIHAH